MDFSTQTSAPEKIKTAALVVGVHADGVLTQAADAVDRAAKGAVRAAVKTDFKGKTGETLVLRSLPGVAAQRVVLTGLGPQEALSPKALAAAHRASLAAVAALGVTETVSALAAVPMQTADVRTRARLAAIAAGDVTLVQVASPSRERVEAYRLLRDEIEITVSRINGDYGTIGHAPVVYLHRGFPHEEMAALYLAADVLAVTSLRDGMNLVAKEYVACRFDERGALLLSEFTGAADELRRAVLVNPHDIDGIKARMLDALRMPEREQAQRMRSMRRTVFRQDVARWSHNFLRAVEAMAAMRGGQTGGGSAPGQQEHVIHVPILPENLDAALRRLVAEPELLIACDFDGTLAPIVPHPDDARVLPRAEQALEVLQEAPGVRIAILSGRSLESLAATGLRLDGRMVAGSHGSEIRGLEGGPAGRGADGDGSAVSVAGAAAAEATADEEARLEGLLATVGPRVAEVEGAWIERKPFGFAVHTRGAASREAADRLLDELADAVRDEPGVWLRDGKRVREFSVRRSDKGEALRGIREAIPAGPVLFIGDDITDEDALRVLGPDDVGVHVGAGESVAEHRVASPESVAAMLSRLAELRCGVVIASE